MQLIYTSAAFPVLLPYTLSAKNPKNAIFDKADRANNLLARK